ncbi:hypothetical protein QE369_001986 [Agrobacterium larrymoorei]|uniref:Uncharacterized protein n=1 Tax=Agrobacterium larrymoorei TaxID=160699 RepID=A0AAJ2B9T1_9HYPH|nr:hypothetical protein [Agrobacterium larrymoorei]MDR6101789.1 hypothetical protein [Agrobacterium larrymoorei]
MVDEIKKSRAQDLNERLGAFTRSNEVDGGKRQVDQWIAVLAAAESAAKAAKNAKPRLFQVNYRIKQGKDQTRGSSDQRRDALVAMLESLKPSEKHASTSTWIVRLYIERANTVLDLLKGPLASSDFLAVAQIDKNRASVGDAKLE